MKRLLLAALLLSGIGTAAALDRELPPLKSPSLGAERVAAIRKAMDAYVLRDIEFRNASLRDAVAFLMQKLRQTDEFKKSGKTFSYALAVHPGVPEETTVTLAAKSIPLPEAIDNLCRQAGLYWRCDGDIAILSKDKADRDTRAPAGP